MKTHFVTHGTGNRTLCRLRGDRPHRSTMAALREGAVVACTICMVVKDAWLELPKRKPLTVRRRNAIFARLARR